MKEVLFVCCNMHCIRTEVLRLVDKIATPGEEFTVTRYMVSDGKTETTFVLAENVEHIHGKRFDKIQTCDRVTIGPGTASALYRPTATDKQGAPLACPRCGSENRDVRKKVYSDSSLYDERECGDQWHNEGKPKRINRGWTWK